MHDLYVEGKALDETYAAMVETILEPVRDGKSTCAAFYGHPGVFVRPGHEAIRVASEEGLPARMLPGISSLDCLFSDLGLDPAPFGCQIYDAGAFLAGGVTPDTSALLLLLQISVVGQRVHAADSDWAGLPRLVERLLHFYPQEHEVIGYEASPYVSVPPIVERLALVEFAATRLTAGMTLVVPPARV